MKSQSPSEMQNHMQSQQYAGTNASGEAPKYTVFVRLPFPRGEFVDPPIVQWDTIKDQALWKIISNSSKSGELDWHDISSRFKVSLDFLMQQAAWLYEQHFAEVRKQMQRLSTTTTSRAADIPRLDTPPDVTISSAVVSRPSSATTNIGPPVGQLSRRDKDNVRSESQHEADSQSPRPKAIRTPSSATITQSRLFTSAQTAVQRSSLEQHRSITPLAEQGRAYESSMRSRTLYQSAFKRSNVVPYESDEDEGSEEPVPGQNDESSSAEELPFAAALRGSGEAREKQRASAKKDSQHSKLPTLASLTPSTIPTHSADDSSSAAPLAAARPHTILSPKAKSRLENTSQRSRMDSDGTPSLGSSFSDLDAGGISASALEDAVLHAGNMSSTSRASGGMGQEGRRGK